MRRIYFSLVLFFVITACEIDPPKHDIISIFPTETDITGQTTSAFDEAIGAIDIKVTENYIILQKRRTDYFFSVYRKEDMSYIMDICKKGEGPDDFLAPIYLEQSKNDNIWVLDRVTSVYYNISLSKSIDERKTFVNKKIDFKPLLDYQIRDMFIIDENRFLYSIDNESCPYYIYDIRGKTNTEVKNNYELSPARNKYQLLQKLSTYNSVEGKFASMYYCFPKSTFFSISVGASKSTLYSDRDINLQESNLDNLVNSCMFFSCLRGTPYYVYYLYNDECNDTDITSKILVYDWDGNPIKSYNLSSQYTSIAIDQDSNRIYALDYEKETNAVTIFDL